jgi:glutathione S-transferase
MENRVDGAQRDRLRLLNRDEPPMMILKSAPPSPFGRKVEIAAAMLGLADEIEIETTDTLDPNDPIRAQNPLGKIPALTLDDGPVLFDSRVIIDYLDHRAGGGRLIPAGGDARYRVLTEAALADGILDAALLQVYETRFRDEARREPKWITHQSEKVARALAAFERRPPEGARTVADVTLACALGYLDLRFGGLWRGDHPKLVAWLAAFAAEVPAFEETRFEG